MNFVATGTRSPARLNLTSSPRLFPSTGRLGTT